MHSAHHLEYKAAFSIEGGGVQESTGGLNFKYKVGMCCGDAGPALAMWSTGGLLASPEVGASGVLGGQGPGWHRRGGGWH